MRRVRRNPRVAHIRAGKITGDLYSRGENCRQILRRMHGHCNISLQQGKIELLGKKPLAAGLAQWEMQNRVAAGFYGDDLDGVRRAMRRFEAILQLARLGERQGAPPRPKSEGESFARSRWGRNWCVSYWFGSVYRLKSNAAGGECQILPPAIQGKGFEEEPCVFSASKLPATKPPPPSSRRGQADLARFYRTRS